MPEQHYSINIQTLREKEWHINSIAKRHTPYEVRIPHCGRNVSYVSTLSCNVLRDDDATFYGKAVDYS